MFSPVVFGLSIPCENIRRETPANLNKNLFSCFFSGGIFEGPNKIIWCPTIDIAKLDSAKPQKIFWTTPSLSIWTVGVQ